MLDMQRMHCVKRMRARSRLQLSDVSLERASIPVEFAWRVQNEQIKTILRPRNGVNGAGSLVGMMRLESTVMKTSSLMRAAMGSRCEQKVRNCFGSHHRAFL